MAKDKTAIAGSAFLAGILASPYVKSLWEKVKQEDQIRKLKKDFDAKLKLVDAKLKALEPKVRGLVAKEKSSNKKSKKA